MMRFKALHSVKAIIDGIETAHMIRKEQLSDENIPAFKQFMALAGYSWITLSADKYGFTLYEYFTDKSTG